MSRNRCFSTLAIFLTLIFIKIDLLAITDEDMIKKSVIGYNMTLIESAKNPEFLKNFDDRKKLERFADRKVAQKLFIWIKSWHENNLYMDARLKDISFGKIVSKKGNVSVITDEVWLYRYFRVIGKNRIEEAYPPAKKIYKVKYTLKREKDSWKITNIDVFSEKEEKL